MLDLEPDRDGNLWFGLMLSGGDRQVRKQDREGAAHDPCPGEIDNDLTQITMVQPRASAVDGKVWTQDNGLAGLHRIDLASGRWETIEPFKDRGGVRRHNLYDVIVELAEQPFFTDFSSSTMGRVDAKTGEISYYEVPTPRRRHASWHDGCGGPAVVRRIPRQPRRHARDQERRNPRMADADSLDQPVRCRRRQERRSVDRQHAERPRRAPRSQDRRDDGISFAARTPMCAASSSTTAPRPSPSGSATITAPRW